MSHPSAQVSRTRIAAGSPSFALLLACAVLLACAARESSASFYSWPVGTGPGSLAVGDLNGDGRPDLVTANDDSTLTVLLNEGGGRFGTRLDLATNEWLAQVAIADLNADAALDLVVASRTLSVFLGNGDGTFREPADYVVSPGVATCVTVGDVNGDGKQDIIAGNGLDNDVAVFPGIGDGTVGAPAYFHANPMDGPQARTGRSRTEQDGTPPFLRSSPVVPMKSALFMSLTVGDLNRDGRADIAAGFDDFFLYGFLQILHGDGQGGFTLGPTFWDTAPTRSVSLADFNADGWDDVAAASSYFQAVSVAIDPWDGTPAVAHLTVPTYPMGVAVGDLDRDGAMDLVSSDHPSEVCVWLGNGSGGFEPPTSFDTGAGPWAVIIADLDGNGKADLATANHDANTVSVLFGDGAGGFGVPPLVDVPTSPAVSALTLAPASPNPVVSAATIRFVLPSDGHASLIVRDAAGRRIARLEDGFLPAGEHVARWNRRGIDGAIAPPGVYLLELRFGGEARVERIAVL